MYAMLIPTPLGMNDNIVTINLHLNLFGLVLVYVVDTVGDICTSLE